MSAVSTQSAGCTLTLTEEERSYLLPVLEQVLRDKQIEVHRTEAFEYREHVQRQEAILQRLIDRLR